MARSGLLRNLLAAWSANDDQQFLHAAHEVIEDERRKGHSLLADQLERTLRDPRRPGGEQSLSLRPLPKGRDERPLLDLGKPKRSIDGLVLPDAVMSAIESIIIENERRSLLSTFDLRPRQRILFLGPPGTGKTVTAHAIADQLSFPVAAVSLSALTSSLLGETARNVESVVRFAEMSPCVLLIDEFDALATDRGQPGEHGELRRVVATLLQALDEPPGESIVVATSNHASMLDTAVWRRFDEVVRFELLQPAGIALLIDLKLRRFASNVDIHHWAEVLVGVSSSDVESFVLDAIKSAVVHGGRPVVTDQHFSAALARLHTRRDVSQLRYT